MQIFNVSGWARLVNMSVEGLGTAVLVLRDRKSAIDRVVVVVDKDIVRLSEKWTDSARVKGSKKDPDPPGQAGEREFRALRLI
ncbi:hypothetical protein AK812_SmicGene44746 [Symbiodinium microadriaticum]|uniref:Uncharacterized protein n=1 Tax=Symbiodinium microadriaticum TaxID=2951 RepID=A0A1Q9BXS0_SYMMI|nr:hypothetical protein AK812_SmicGene44746 [Symbiodinium microadriaticum]